MIKGVIFDLDGTLIDSMKVWYNADRTFLRENGIEPPSDISEKVKKMTITEAANYFINTFKMKITPEYVINRIEEIVSYQYREVITLKPNVIKLLDFLDECGIPYGIATATYKSLARSVLERYGIYDRFSFVVTGEDVAAGKTSPDIYFECARLLNVNKSDVIIAEDSLHCIETAVSAGFFTVCVYDEASESELEKMKQLSNKTVYDIFEIKDLIKSVNA